MSWIKYVLCPGDVRSKNDGDTHYISTAQLARCYKVPLRECVIRPEYDHHDARLHTRFEAAHQDLIWLYPDESGEYQIPTTKGPRA